MADTIKLLYSTNCVIVHSCSILSIYCIYIKCKMGNINTFLNKASSVLEFIQCKLRHANNVLKKIAYVSFVSSTLRYSSSVWKNIG